MTELRDYQLDVIADLDRAIATGRKRPLVVMPTGAGKTVVAADIISKAVAEQKHVLVLAHTREIIRQTSEKLFAHGIDHGVIQAGFMTRPDEAVQVASVQTLWSRAVRSNRMDLPAADILLVDEAHHTPARTYQKSSIAIPTRF